MKTFLVTGGTGLIGTAFISRSPAINFIVLTRQSAATLKSLFHTNVRFINSLDEISSDTKIDAAINLAGEPIAAKAWSDSYKHTIYASRIETTHELVRLSKRLTLKIDVCISGSAVGIYGDQKDISLSESAALGNDYAAQLCIDWENAAKQIQCERLCIIRTGLVLSPKGGFLKEMAPSFKLGLGAALGTGEHYMPWVHIEDMVSILNFLLEERKAEGAFNATAPQPAKNLAFSKAYASSLHRPCFLRLPKFVIKMIFGERSTLLLGSQRCIPDKLLNLGYRFRYCDVHNALNNLA